MIVADSDVLIDALRGREPSASRVAQEIRKGTLATTSINSFEKVSEVSASSGLVELDSCSCM